MKVLQPRFSYEQLCDAHRTSFHIKKYVTVVSVKQEPFLGGLLPHKILNIQL